MPKYGYRDYVGAWPLALVSLIWTIGLLVPFSLYFAASQNFTPTDYLIGGAIIANGTVGILSLLCALAGVMGIFTETIPRVFGGAVGTRIGSSNSPDDLEYLEDDSRRRRWSMDDKPASMINPGTGLEMDGSFDAAGYTFGDGPMNDHSTHETSSIDISNNDGTHHG